jgi:hypothetical protein
VSRQEIGGLPQQRHFRATGVWLRTVDGQTGNNASRLVLTNALALIELPAKTPRMMGAKGFGIPLQCRA